MNTTTGTPGQVFFNTTYNAWFDWIVDRWYPRIPDSRYGFYVHDEFVAQDIAKGTLGWLAVGSANPNPVSSGSQFGVYQVNMTTAGNWGSIFLYNSGIQVGTADITIEGIIQMPVLANGTTDFSVTFGFNDNPNASASTGSCTNGVYFNYSRAVNGGNWTCYSSQAATATTSNSGVAGATGWTRLTIVVSASTSAKFYINGTLVSTISTNLPAGASQYSNCAVFKLDKIAGAAQSVANIDCLAIWGFFNGQRAA